MTKRIITVKESQCLIDISLQEFGTVESVFDIVLENGLSEITETIVAGQQLVISGEPVNINVVNQYKLLKINPANANPDDASPVGGAFTSGFSNGFEN